MDVIAFETKDSGKREQFASGMVRDTQEGKLRYDLAFDGPLFWSCFDDTYQGALVRAMQRWYEQGGLVNASAVVLELAKLVQGGLFEVVDRYAGLMMRGAIKYSERNWMQAEGEAELKRFRSSACRHFKQYIHGETDEDHLAAVFFNLNGAEYVRSKMAA
jgi:hypothetical protein